MAQTTKSIIAVLQQMRQVDLTDEINRAKLTKEEKEIVRNYIKETQNMNIPKFIAYLENLQSAISENAAKNLLRFLKFWPYTSPLAQSSEGLTNENVILEKITQQR